MKYVLDINAVALLMTGAASALERLGECSKRDVFLPQPVVSEVSFGLAAMRPSARRTDLARKWTALETELQRIAWTDEVSQHFASIKAALQKRGQRLEDIDIAVAAHALAIDATLATAAARPSARIKGLRIDDWSTY